MGPLSGLGKWLHDQIGNVTGQSQPAPQPTPQPAQQPAQQPAAWHAPMALPSQPTPTFQPPQMSQPSSNSYPNIDPNVQSTIQNSIRLTPQQKINVLGGLNANKPQSFNPWVAGAQSLGEGVRDMAGGFVGAVANTVKTPIDAMRLHAANTSGDYQGAQDIQKNLNDEANNNIFNNPLTQKTGDLLSTAFYQPTADANQQRAHQQTVQTISNAYGNTPRAQNYAEGVAANNDRQVYEQQLARQSLTPTDSLGTVAWRVGAPVVAGLAQAPLMAGGLGAGAEAAEAGLLPVLKSAVSTGGINAATNVAATASDPNASPLDYAKAAGMGFIGGAALPLAGAGIKAGAPLLSDALKTGAQKISDFHTEPRLQAGEQASGLQRQNIINDNETGTLRDWADYQTGSYKPDVATINQLTRQARNAAGTAGIDVTSGSPIAITDRIYNYLSQRRSFISAHDGFMQAGGVIIENGTRISEPIVPGTQTEAPVVAPQAPQNQPIRIDRTQLSGTATSLRQEALKYKSADEFIENNMQAKRMAPEDVQVGHNISVATRTLDGSVDHLAGKVVKVENGLEGSKIAYIQTPNGKVEETAIKDGDNYSGKTDRTIVNTDIEKSPQQLTDLYNQAHAEAKSAPPQNQPIRIDRTKLTGLQLDTPNRNLTGMTPEAYANTFDVPLDHAVSQLDKPTPPLNKRPGVTPLERDSAIQGSMSPKLSPQDRQNLIANEAVQQTKNKVELNVPEGNVKGAIAQSGGIADERLARFSQAVESGNKLSEDLKGKVSDALNGEPVDISRYSPKEQARFQDTLSKLRDAYDYSLASDRAAGGTTLRWNNGNYSPLYLSASDARMDELGIPQQDRIANGKFHGFRDTARKLKSYGEASKAGFQGLFGNGIEDAKHYALTGDMPIRQALLKEAITHAAPHDVAEAGMGREANNTPFQQAPGGLPFYASKDLRIKLRGFGGGIDPSTKAGKIALKAANTANGLSKGALFMGTPFHYFNLLKNYLGLTVTTGHLATSAKGLASGVFSQVPGGYARLLESAKSSGTMDWIRQSGLKLHEDNVPLKDPSVAVRIGSVTSKLPISGTRLGEFTNTLAIQLANAAKEHGIDPTSPQGVALAQEYGKVLGLINSEVAGDAGWFRDATRFGGLAPQWTRSQLALVKDAVTSFQGSKGIGLYNAGDVARGTVVGARFVQASAAIIGSALATGAMPTFSQMINDAGFNPKNPVPNVEGTGKNQKGEKMLADMPTDPAGLAFGLATDPAHFLQSRFSPVLSAGVKLATNTDWNGQPLADKNIPGWQADTAKKIAQGFLPIAIQNHTNPNLTLGQSLAEDIGARYKTDPNDPQVQANNKYSQTSSDLTNTLASGKLSQINPSLKDISPQDAHQWVQQLNALHPSGTTDPSGSKYPARYNPLSSEQRYASYIDSGSGTPQLSPLFYIDQKLNGATPGYPHSPLYDLQGTGTDANGQQSPQALVAMEYQHVQDPGAKSLLMQANGGSNGWLSNYENTSAKYSTGYQQNLTNYMKQQGWSGQAVDDYWKNHPSAPDPIAQVNLDQPTTDLMAQYQQKLSSGDSTDASKFFSQHADTLQSAFDQIAQHANALRAAKGELQLQGYPAESDHVKQILSSMPAGADTASKATRGKLISGNKDVAQYLANVSLYETLNKGDQFRYKDPANIQNTQAQNVSNGSTQAQAFLKSAHSLGTHDIGFNPTTGQYEFMQNGGFQQGFQSGSGKSGQKTPHIFLRRTKPIKVRHLQKQHKVFLQTPPSPIKIKNRVNKHVGINRTTYL